MKILLPIDTDINQVGGAWTFIRNLKKGLEQAGHWLITDRNAEADIALVAGATTVVRETFYEIQKRMPVVLRIDGIPEDWRNRGTGTTRLKEFAKAADGVIYQSEWSRNLVGKLLGRDGGVIYNGVDFDVFKPSGEKAPLPKGNPKVLHVMWRQDPAKRPEEVIWSFREYSLINKNALLVLVGNYPQGWADYNFGLFNDEKFIHIAEAREEELAKIMRACDVLWFPSFADTCPNTVLEAMACGLPVELTNEYGGVEEIVKRGTPDNVRQMAEQYFTFFEFVLRKGVKVVA